MTAAAKPLSLLEAGDVHEAMGSDAALLADVTPSFESAITRSVIKLQTVLGTSLKPLSNTDIFYVDETARPLNDRLKLRLTNGLVRQDQPVTVMWTSEVDGTYEAVDNAVWEYKKGFVMIPLWTPVGRYSSLSYQRSSIRQSCPFYVKVTYASGLIDNTDKVEDYEELRQAVLSFVPGFIMSTADAATASPKAMYAVMAKQKRQGDAADDMLIAYMRTLAPSIRPFQSLQSVLMV
jgi:hypothetical protein